MFVDDTIAAVATGWSPSRLAIVRLSGPGALAVLDELVAFDPAGESGVAHETTQSRSAIAHTILRGTLAIESPGGSLPVPCLAMRFVEPHSYTGQHAAELIVPGNPHLLERLMAQLLRRENVREATPGEFTARAFLNGRMSLDQAEGVAAIIGAETDAQHQCALEMREGKTGRMQRDWTETLATCLALVEAGIDFTDQEDVRPIAPDDLAAQIKTISGAITEMLGSAAGREMLAGLPQVVLVGAPNAGKSTLFNALLGRTRSVVSEVAGTTRDLIVEQLDLTRDAPGAGAIELIDPAGLDDRDTDELDALGRAAAVEAIASADCIVWCDPTGAFRAMPGSSNDVPVIRVRTKADLVHGSPDNGVAVCALDGWNLPVLRRALADASARCAGVGTVRAITPRHRRAMTDALTHLALAHQVVEGDAGDPEPVLHEPELVASSLRGALDALGELTGQISPDEIIGRVFAVFCVGK